MPSWSGTIAGPQTIADGDTVDGNTIFTGAVTFDATNATNTVTVTGNYEVRISGAGGKLLSSGDSTHTCILTSTAKATNSDWYGLTIYFTASVDSHLHWMQIEYAAYGFDLKQACALIEDINLVKCGGTNLIYMDNYLAWTQTFTRVIADADCGLFSSSLPTGPKAEVINCVLTGWAIRDTVNFKNSTFTTSGGNDCIVFGTGSTGSVENCLLIGPGTGKGVFNNTANTVTVKSTTLYGLSLAKSSTGDLNATNTIVWNHATGLSASATSGVLRFDHGIYCSYHGSPVITNSSTVDPNLSIDYHIPATSSAATIGTIVGRPAKDKEDNDWTALEAGCFAAPEIIGPPLGTLAMMRVGR